MSSKPPTPVLPDNDKEATALWLYAVCYLAGLLGAFVSIILGRSLPRLCFGRAVTVDPLHRDGFL